MIIQEIEYYFQEKKLDELLVKYQECFDRIHYYETAFKKGQIHNAFETDKAMKELVGIYSSLNIVVALAETYEINEELKTYNQIIFNFAGTARSLDSDLAKKQAAESVNNYRRITNIFRAYLDNVDKTIFVCQSSLKSEDREHRLTRG